MELYYYYVKSWLQRVTQGTNKPFGEAKLVSQSGEVITSYFFDATVSYADHVIGLRVKSEPDAKGFHRSRLEDIQYCGRFDQSTLPDVFEWVRPHLHAVPTVEEFVGLVTSLLEDYKSSERWGALVAEVLSRVPKLAAQYCQSWGARKHHHNYPGGLAQHVYEVLQMFSGIHPTLPFFVDPVICTVAILYHDLGKIYEYDAAGDYTETLVLTPHSLFSAEYIGRTYRKLISKRDLQLIQHVIYTHHGRVEWGAPMLPAMKEALLVSQLDYLSSAGCSMEGAPNLQHAPGMDRRIIKSEV